MLILVATLIPDVLFKQLLIFIYNRLKIAGNEVSSFQVIIEMTGACGAMFLFGMRGFTSNNKAVPLPYILFIENNCFQKQLTNKYTKKIRNFQLK